MPQLVSQIVPAIVNTSFPSQAVLFQENRSGHQATWAPTPERETCPIHVGNCEQFYVRRKIVIAKRPPAWNSKKVVQGS